MKNYGGWGDLIQHRAEEFLSRKEALEVLGNAISGTTKSSIMESPVATAKESRIMTADEIDRLRGVLEQLRKTKEMQAEKIAILEIEVEQYKDLSHQNAKETREVREELNEIIDMQRETIESLMNQMSEVTQGIHDEETTTNDNPGVSALGCEGLESRPKE